MWNNFDFYSPYAVYFGINYGYTSYFHQQGSTDPNYCIKSNFVIEQYTANIPEQKKPLKQMRQRRQSKRCLDRLKRQKKKQREDNYMRKAQKKDRNLPSNILKNFITYLFTKCSIIQSQRKVLGQQEKIYFLSLVQKLRQVGQVKANYVPASAISQLWVGDLLSLGQRVVIRKILKDYLKNVYPLIMICSGRYKKVQKMAYLKTARSLFEGFFGRREELRE